MVTDRETHERPDWLVPGGRDVTALFDKQATLEIHLPSEQSSLTGRRTIARWMSERWAPGAIVRSCEVLESRGGMRVRAEVAAEGRSTRERHLVHIEHGLIVRHIIYPEKVPPRLGAESIRSNSPALAGADPSRVVRTPLPPGFSGAPIEMLVLESGRKLIAKHIAPRWSWVMRATKDDGREAALWANQIHPLPGVDAAVVDAAQLRDRWILYMHDVSRAVSSSLDEGRLLETLAGLYEQWPAEELSGLCNLEGRIALFSPDTSVRERSGWDLGPKIIGRGWELILDLIPVDLSELALDLIGDPRPLVEALRSMECFLIHGDLRPGNVGQEEGRVVLIDWGLATFGPPALDLVWYAFNSRAFETIDEGLTAVRHACAGRFGDEATDLAVLATFIQACPYFGFNAVQEPDPELRAAARRDLSRWIDQAQEAIRRSGHLIRSPRNESAP